MIEFLSKWAGQLTVAVVIATLIEMILPNGKNKKYIKMVIGIYIIFCIISPFLKNDISFSEYKIENVIDNYSKSKENVNQTSMDKRLEELYIEELQKDIAEKLKKKGFVVKKCKIEASLNATSDDAGINKIELKVEKKVTNGDNVQKIDEIEIGISSQNKESNTNEADIKTIKDFLSDEYEIDQSNIKIIF
ncbi:MAG: stage III sporulation protein AF [Clostridia bacterium]|nr:stage III sporulation protein AF [Clostridia bacterium]